MKIVSCTEMVMCYAYTASLLFALLPGGVRPDAFCMPKQNFAVVVRILLLKQHKPAQSQPEKSILSSLGCNNTQRSVSQVSDPECVGATYSDEHLKKLQQAGRAGERLGKENGDISTPVRHIDEAPCLTTQEWSQYPTDAPRLPQPIKDFNKENLIGEGHPERQSSQGPSHFGAGTGEEESGRAVEQLPLTPIPEANEEQFLANALSAVSLEETGKESGPSLERLNKGTDKLTPMNQ